MECTRKEGQSYEIHVCFIGPGTGIYDRLRFVPLTLPWLLRPLAILLWSALHALLVLGLVLFLVSAGVTWFLFSLLCATIWVANSAIIPVSTLIYGIWCLSSALTRLIWSLMWKSERLHQISVAWRGFVALWVELDVRESICDYICFIFEAMFSVFGHLYNYIVREWRPWCGVLARLCEEVVHMHDAIVI